MKRLALLGAIILSLASCGTVTPSPSPAERFEHLKRQLQNVTRGSEQVAADALHLQRYVRAGEVARGRRASVTLKLHGLSLARQAGRVGNQVRALMGSESDARLHEYFRLIEQTLSWQWYEGMALARVADLVWADPLVTTGRAERELASVAGQARRYAYLATLSASRATTLRRRYPRSFSYQVLSR